MSNDGKNYSYRLLGQTGNTLITLIAIQLVMFVGFAFLKIVYQVNHGNEEGLVYYDDNVLPWFTLSAHFSTIISRPWTILTHMFLHLSFIQVFSNMLWLWTFGFILNDLAGNRKVIPLFLYGALAGAIGFVLAYNFIPALKPLSQLAFTFGASAGILSVAIGATTLSPGYRIFPMLSGGIPLWVLTIIYVVIDVVTIPLSNTGVQISHLFGTLTGFLFIFFYKKGYDWSSWINNFFDWVSNLFNPDKPKKGKRMRQELFYKSSSTPFTKTSNVTQQRIDEILDKINQQGYESLTFEERELLKRASKEEL